MSGRSVKLLKLKAKAQKINLAGPDGAQKFRALKRWWYGLNHMEKTEERQMLKLAIAAVGK